jgi:hypothetical protein
VGYFERSGMQIFVDTQPSLMPYTWCHGFEVACRSFPTFHRCYRPHIFCFSPDSISVGIDFRSLALNIATDGEQRGTAPTPSAVTRASARPNISHGCALLSQLLSPSKKPTREPTLQRSRWRRESEGEAPGEKGVRQIQDPVGEHHSTIHPTL